MTMSLFHRALLISVMSSPLCHLSLVSVVRFGYMDVWDCVRGDIWYSCEWESILRHYKDFGPASSFIQNLLFKWSRNSVSSRKSICVAHWSIQLANRQPIRMSNPVYLTHHFLPLVVRWDYVPQSPFYLDFRSTNRISQCTDIGFEIAMSKNFYGGVFTNLQHSIACFIEAQFPLISSQSIGFWGQWTSDSKGPSLKIYCGMWSVWSLNAVKLIRSSSLAPNGISPLGGQKSRHFLGRGCMISEV